MDAIAVKEASDFLNKFAQAVRFAEAVKELGSLDDEKAALLARAEEQREVVAELDSKIEALSNNIATAKANLAAVRQELTAAETTAERQRQQAVSAARAAGAEAKAQLEAEIDNKRAELAKLNEEISAREVAAQVELAAQNERLAAIKKEISETLNRINGAA